MPSNLQRECHVVANQVPNMAPALGDLYQSAQLLVARVRFYLKFYFNFFQMSFCMGPSVY